MSNLKKVVLRQSRKKDRYGWPIPLARLDERGERPSHIDYEVVSLENTIGFEMGEILSKDDVQQLICKPNMKVVVK